MSREKKNTTIGERFERSKEILGGAAYRAPELRDGPFEKMVDKARDECDLMTILLALDPRCRNLTVAQLAAELGIGEEDSPVFVSPEEQVKGISNWAETALVDGKKAETIGELLEKSTSVVWKLAECTPELRGAVFTKNLEEACDERDRLTGLMKKHPNAKNMTEAELAACTEKQTDDLMSQVD